MTAAAVAGGRLPALDALRALAAQLIVWHHLAFYGPMSDRAAVLAPKLLHWLAHEARLAVQVFLVLGGYLAARQLAPDGRLRPGTRLASLALARYRRLALPYAAMLALAIVAAALARRWLDGDLVPERPGFGQLLAHLLLLQDVLGVPALSAGVWYVAIDFQLFAVALLLLGGCARLEARLGARRALAPWALLAAVAASLLHFNRDAAWDAAAPYFVGAWGLGALVAWAPALPRREGRMLLGAACALVLLALVLDFRERLAVAATVALLLAAQQSRPDAFARLAAAPVAWLGRTSYSLFLVHFPVLLVVAAAFTRFAPAEPAAQGLGLLVAWGASLAASALFHRHVEGAATRPRRALASTRRAEATR